MNLRKLSVLLAVIASASVAAKKDKDSVLDWLNQRVAYIAKTVTELNEKEECTTVIMASDIGTAGYVITQPGTYCLGEDIVFNPADPSTFVPVTFTDGGGSGAAGFAAVSAGVVRGVFLTNRGTGYTSAPSVTFGGSGSGAAGVAVLGTGAGNNAPVGTIAFVQMTSGGSGYQDTVQAAITIMSSNVTLNFNGKELSQFVPANPSAQVPFVVGVLVPDVLPDPTSPTAPNVVVPANNTTAIGLESVYIVGNDGIVSNFSMYGVRIFAHTSDIEVNDLTIKDGAALASKALGRPTATGLTYLPHDYLPAFPPPLGNPTISSFGPSFGVAGIAIGESAVFGQGPLFFTDLPLNQLNVTNRIENVRLNNVNANNNFLSGGSIIGVTDLTIDNSHFDYTYSDDPGSNVVPVYNTVLAYGMNFSNASQGLLNANEDPCNLNFAISNSTFNNSMILGDYQTPLANGSSPFNVLGMFGTRNKNGVFLNCQFNSSSCTFPNLGGNGTVAGYASGGDEDLVFQNCNCDNAFNLGAINGWHMSGNTSNELTKSARNIKLINCTSNNHQVRSDLVLPAPVLTAQQSIGFLANFGKGYYFEDCQTRDIYFSGPALPTTRSLLGFSIGVTTQLQAQVTDITYKNCVASRVQAVNGGASIGFNNNNPTAGETDNSLIWEDCKSTGNQALLASVYPAWSSGTTYAVGALVSLTVGGVVNNFVSLQSGNVGNSPTPGSATAFWSPINTAPAAWNVTTNYGIGALVSYTIDAYGHVNEYVSVVANNLGNYPTAPGIIGTVGGVAWVQTNVYPTWSSTATYITNMIVGFNGVSYLSRVSNNINNSPATSPTQWTSSTGVLQGFCNGFFTINELNTATAISGPEIYRGCLAVLNTGTTGKIGNGAAARYSGGFFAFSAQDSLYDSCIAEENSGYGFILTGSCVQCIVRNCQSDNNTNEGFTDLGLSTTTTPTAVAVSGNLFESNRAYNNGLGGSGPGAPNFFGINQNYNVQVAPGVTPPLLTGQVSTSAYAPINPATYFASVHNNSIIK